jgi:hypothetical protein
MSDDTTSVDPSVAEAPAPEIGQGEPEATPSPEYLDTDSYATHHVRMKVDGQDIEVPLSEALAGYSRHADYTRKTQELAEQQRQAQFGLTLQQALENNPQMTLRILQEQYAQQAEPEPQQEPDWTDDPNQAQLREISARLERYEAAQAQADLRAAIGVLQERYGEEFNPREVVARASAQGRMDLEGVYKEMAFERYWAGRQAAQEQQQAEEAARIASKAEPTGVHSGNGAGNTQSPDAGSFPTIEDAFYSAKRQLGIS